jgi:hypothetical protein
MSGGEEGLSGRSQVSSQGKEREISLGKDVQIPKATDPHLLFTLPLRLRFAICHAYTLALSLFISIFFLTHIILLLHTGPVQAKLRPYAAFFPLLKNNYYS